MKKYLFLLLLFFCCLLTGGCGRQEASSTLEGTKDSGETKEYYDIMVENNAFPELDHTGQALYFLGMQFYRGEAVQLWGQLHFGGAGGEDKTEIFRYKMDGSRETATWDVPSEYIVFFSRGYQDSEGNFYFWDKKRRSSEEPFQFIILDPSGKELYRTDSEEEDYFQTVDVFQTEEGTVYWIIYDKEMTEKLAKSKPGAPPEAILDMDQWDPGPMAFLGDVRLGEKGGEICLVRKDGFWQMDLEEESLLEILPFLGTSYETWEDESGVARWYQQGFRVLEDGSVELLGCYDDGTGAVMQRLHKGKVEKIPLVMRAEYFSPWVRKRISRFNQENDTYYVVLEEFWCAGEKWASYDSDLEDFVTRTSIEIATGKGPDIFLGTSMLGDAVISLIEKGALVDLAPFMEADGIREEDYFPVAFCWRKGDGIYGISPTGDFSVYKTDPRLLGGKKEVSDIETLVDALLAWPEEAVYMERVDSTGLLRVFLEGSEDLWGMVDWEEGTCDFSGELLGKLLAAAGRFGYDPRKNLPVLAFDWSVNDIYENQVGNSGLSGVLFDDGCHGVVSPGVFSINSNSANQEGAWEFLRFLLGEEMQSAFRVYSSPVLKTAFEEWIRKDLKLVQNGRVEYRGMWDVRDGEVFYVTKTFRKEDFTEKVINEYINAVENARMLPVRPEPLLNIICEEAADYFNGSKSVEETAAVIRNRVQLYLDEHR